MKFTTGGEVLETRNECQEAGVGRVSRNYSVPLMRRWLRTNKTIVLELNVPLLQMNFFDDHTKLIVSRQGSGFLITYIDGERRASTYWLDDLRQRGCTAELHERLLYIYKVAKEFADLDAGKVRIQ